MRVWKCIVECVFFVTFFLYIYPPVTCAFPDVIFFFLKCFSQIPLQCIH